MSVFSNFLKQAAPVVATVAPFVPGGQAIAAVASAKVAADRRAAIRYQTALAEERNKKMAMDFGGSSRPTFVDPYKSQLIPNAGLGEPNNFFGNVRSGLQEVGGFVSDVFSSGIPQLFGLTRPKGVSQQPAVTTVTNVGAQESQGSGSIQAGAGSLLPQLIGGARSLLKSPLGQVGLGSGVGAALSMLGSDGKQMRITRKMKSQARMILNMTGGNIAMAADILNIDQNTLIMILLKRFRNDGPVVTKAALRKTKQTVRRLKSMCDMYDDLRPRARSVRRTPARRSTTTLIKN
jgi:hypothetical protein